LSWVQNFFGQRDSQPSSSLQQEPERVEPPWETLVLVCSKCRGARRGPDARDLRKGLKSRIGKNKRLRIIEAECLSICPDDAIAVCIAKTSSHGSSTEVRIVQSHDELDALATLVTPR